MCVKMINPVLVTSMLVMMLVMMMLTVKKVLRSHTKEVVNGADRTLLMVQFSLRPHASEVFLPQQRNLPFALEPGPANIFCKRAK